MTPQRGRDPCSCHHCHESKRWDSRRAEDRVLCVEGIRPGGAVEAWNRQCLGPGPNAMTVVLLDNMCVGSLCLLDGSQSQVARMLSLLLCSPAEVLLAGSTFTEKAVFQGVPRPAQGIPINRLESTFFFDFILFICLFHSFGPPESNFGWLLLLVCWKNR